METRTDLEILGQRLVVRGEEPPEYVRRLGDYLDARARRVRDQAHVYDPLRLSLLAGLHVADELFRAREREAALAARVEALIDRLKDVVGDATASEWLDEGPRSGA